MARKPRIHLPGSHYHVMLRGNSGEDVFFCEEDYYYLCFLIQEGIDKYSHRVHAFCYMNNHIHLLIQVSEISLSKIIQNLAFRYTRWINYKMKRVGHLFQGRYKAILIDSDSYLLQLVKYIHLNPVKANLTKYPEEYHWSSHWAYLGRKNIPWLTTGYVLSQFSKYPHIARSYYQAFINENLYENNREVYEKGNYEGRLLGDDTFICKTLQSVGEATPATITIENLIRIICNFFEVEPSNLVRKGRQRNYTKIRCIIAYFVNETATLSLSNLAKVLNRDSSTLSAQAFKIKNSCHYDRKLEQDIKKIKELVFYNANMQA